MHQPLPQSRDAVIPLERAAATCVVARRCGVMHVFNNSPLAPCGLAHLPFHVDVYACARMCRTRPPVAREPEPSVLLFHVAPIGEWSRCLISDTPMFCDPGHIFLLLLLCFHNLLPSSHITPRTSVLTFSPHSHCFSAASVKYSVNLSRIEEKGNDI